MPVQPPVFGAAGRRERKSWQRAETVFPDRRKRGRAAVKERAAIVAEEPFCQRCLEQGRHVRTDVIDHIIPLAWGGSDGRANKQGLCHPCHDAKSKAERASNTRGRGG